MATDPLPATEALGNGLGWALAQAILAGTEAAEEIRNLVLDLRAQKIASDEDAFVVMGLVQTFIDVADQFTAIAGELLVTS